MSVSETAKAADVTPEIIRYYTRIGLLKPKKNRRNGYRLYSLYDVDKILFIRKAKNLGYTLGEIKKILSHSITGKSPCPLVRTIIESRIEENRRRLNEMLALQSRMETALEQWKELSDGVPDGNSICVLIESFAHQEDQENDS